MLSLFDRITDRVPGGVHLAENGGMVDGPLLVNGLGRLGFRVHAVSNGEMAALAVLNPSRAQGSVDIQGSNLLTHTGRIYGLRTGYFDKEGEMILDPERFGNEDGDLGDVTYLVSVTKPKSDIFGGEERAYSAVSKIAREMVLSQLSSQFIQEV